MAVPEFKVEYKLCLNGQAVPVQKKEMIIVDPLNLAATNALDLPESTEVTLVSFKATADVAWLWKSLELPGGDQTRVKSRWWVHNSSRLPLLLEIKEAIKNLKHQKKTNQPTDHQCLILLEIRGKLLYVQNTSAAVTLGLTKEPGTLNVLDPETEPLTWFCTQLQKDMGEHLQEKADKRNQNAEHQEKVQEVLDQLKEHPQCHLIHFIPSRMIFRIVKKNLHGPANAGRVSEVRVVGLNKWRKTEGASGSSEAQDPFQKSLSLGLSFLDAPEDVAPVPAPRASMSLQE